jgi:two-component system cell cycle response regulator
MKSTGTKTLISSTLVGFSVGARERKMPCIVQFSGQELGRPYFLNKEVNLIGRQPRTDIRLNEQKVSRSHARILVRGQQCWLEDLKSANGTYLNKIRLVQPQVLSDGDLITIGAASFKFFAAGNAEQIFYDEIYRKATIDEKTGVFNDKFLASALRSELETSLSFGRPMSIIILDLDHFKKVNDSYGHLFGDHVLKISAEIFSRCIRKNDILCRYGGEEFVVVLPETDLKTTLKLANRIRTNLADFVFTIRNGQLRTNHQQTLSAGVATLSPKLASVSALLKAADAKLYESKRAGRNRVSG